jgi:hypothetical protein
LSGNVLVLLVGASTPCVSSQNSDLLANRAADAERGRGAFAVTLPIKVAAARFKHDAEIQIAYHAIKGSAQASCTLFTDAINAFKQALASSDDAGTITLHAHYQLL